MAKPNLLNSIKLSRPKKSVFDLSHDVKLSGNMGYLIPVLCLEVVPSDKVQVSHESLLRFQPLVAPMMHRCDVSFHDFFVPSRLLWPNFEKWITNQKVAGVLPAHPTLTVGRETNTVEVGSLADYLGIPLTDNSLNLSDEQISALPFAAYQMIYNEYYRDQNNIDPVDFELIDGDNSSNPDLWVLRKRAWEHDYFTAAAPSAQRGEAVDLPLGDVVFKGSDSIDPLNPPIWTAEDGSVDNGIVQQILSGGAHIEIQGSNDAQAYDPSGTLTTQPTTINDLRTAFRLQEWLEKSMRGGQRLFENILVFFGLRSPDSRLQRPEYISGSKTPVQISEVLNTTGTDEAPQGTMAGHGVAVVNPRSGGYTAQEWGYVITIMSVMPKTAYQQGIHRMFLKHRDPMQVYWPQFDHLGEQEIEQRELYAYTSSGQGTFGYIPRYAEYKFMTSRVAGDFRSSLDFWHMGRIFGEQQGLNQEFIEANPTHRVFAVETPEEHKLLIHVYHKIRAIRPMSKFSTPTF